MSSLLDGAPVNYLAELVYLVLLCIPNRIADIKTSRCSNKESRNICEVFYERE